MLKEIPIKLTIIDCVETPETGHVAHCILNIDDKEEISFKFGLTGDSPQDITNFLVYSVFKKTEYAFYIKNEESLKKDFN